MSPQENNKSAKRSLVQKGTLLGAGGTGHQTVITVLSIIKCTAIGTQAPSNKSHLRQTDILYTRNNSVDNQNKQNAAAIVAMQTLARLVVDVH